jgi:hypothetical protein
MLRDSHGRTVAPGALDVEAELERLIDEELDPGGQVFDVINDDSASDDPEVRGGTATPIVTPCGALLECP